MYINKKGLPSSAFFGEKPTLFQYLKDISQFKAISRAEESSLAKSYKNGCRKSGEKIINSHLKFVVKIANLMLKNDKSSILNLIQEGSIGLLEALDNFDLSKGFRFSTYSAFYVRNKIYRQVMKDHSIVTLPESHDKRKLFFKLNGVKALIGADGNPLTQEEVNQIAAMLEVSKKEVVFMDQFMRRGDQSLNTPISIDDNKTELQDTIEDNSHDDFVSYEDFLIDKIEGKKTQSQNILRMRQAINNVLDKREKTIIEKRRLLQKQENLLHIGKQLGISAERVRQIENEAIRKLRKNFSANLKRAS